MFYKILCLLGIHRWEEPYHKYPIQYILDIMFWSYGIQKGIRKCKYCDKEQYCYREGIVGSGGYAGKWSKLKNADISTIH